MNIGMAIAGSAFTSAALTLFFDPISGNRRRRQMRDQITSRAHDFGGFLDVSRRDLKNRAVGLFGDARYRLRGRDVSDDQLVCRVAAKLGRYVSHPKAMDITAKDGRVTLKGLILRHETQPALKAVAAVPGVREVLSELQEHAEPGDIPVLQGGRPRSGDQKDFLQENWSPATRLILGAAGSSFALDGLRRGGSMGAGEVVLGSLLFARSSTNRPVRRLLDFGRKGRVADILFNADRPEQDVVQIH